MRTFVARVLTVMALGLTAGLTARAYAASMTAGAADTATQAARPMPPQLCASGVRGTIVQRSGDLMPPLDPTRAKITPLSVPVYFFQGTVCVATIHSGPDGRFQMALPAGRYTIVTPIGEAGHVARTVQVQEDRWTELDIHVDVGATY